MNMDKSRQAELLFSEIGEIRDVWIQESITYAPIRRRSSARVALIAACIAISLIAVLSVTIVLFQRAPDPTSPPQGSQTTPSTPTTPSDPALPSANALDDLMLEHRAVFDSSSVGSVNRLASVEEFRFTNRSACLVWQYTDSDALYVSRSLTYDEIDTLTREIGKAEPVGESSPTLNCRIWIVFHDGTVISPYLPISAGNTSHALLFDYQAELAPTERFLSCVSNLINEGI